MNRPKMLDLFCGAGGCAVGYHRAGFDVVGVDINPQPRYPFASIESDAIDFLRCLNAGASACGYYLSDFAAVHASPPCQEFSPLKAVCKGKTWPNLIPQTRALLSESGLSYVIENVPGAPVNHWFMLCGAMFGLRTYRHRRFECSTLIWTPDHPPHLVRTNRKKDRRKAHWEDGGFVSVVGDIGTYVGPEAMGIDWMNGNELSQAIPPAYTEWIGRQLLAALKKGEPAPLP